jgi:hypothetical protein
VIACDAGEREGDGPTLPRERAGRANMTPRERIDSEWYLDGDAPLSLEPQASAHVRFIGWTPRVRVIVVPPCHRRQGLSNQRVRYGPLAHGLAATMIVRAQEGQGEESRCN